MRTTQGAKEKPPSVASLRTAASAGSSGGIGAPSVAKRSAVLSASSTAPSEAAPGDCEGTDAGALLMAERGRCSDGAAELAAVLSAVRGTVACSLSDACPGLSALTPCEASARARLGSSGGPAAGGMGGPADGGSTVCTLPPLLPFVDSGDGRNGSLRRMAAPVSDRDCPKLVTAAEPLLCAWVAASRSL